MARASDPGSTERLERAGADRVVSPFVSSGRHMVRMAQDPSIVDLFDEDSGADRSISVEERLIDEGDALQGRTVGDVPGVVLALRRSDGSVMARPECSTTLQVNDVMLLLAAD